MTITVLRAGLLTSVQDGGRFGHRHLGVGTSGALDTFSARVANLLVGNDDGAALLEITLAGPTLRFERGARIALGGATLDARVLVPPPDGGEHALPGWRPIDIPAGSELRLGACRDGARAYLAVQGGIDAPRRLGSFATDLRGAFGGLHGRALQAGDSFGLSCAGARDRALRIASWWVDPRPEVDLSQPARAHVLPGRDALTDAGALFDSAWRVASASDRQGLRLEGTALAAADTRERVSAPVAPGTVQLPPDGRPIVLLGDAQTVGGYPCIGHVATADLPRLAQCRPGDPVHFVPLDRAGALARLREQAQRLQRMALAIAARRD